MPRAIWSGSISFGLVNVPVKMQSAIEENDLRFPLVHAEDGGRIGYDKVCRLEGRAVPDEEIRKALELEGGDYVYLDDADFAAAETDAARTIDIQEFVRQEEIDPIYLERTYYLAPQEGAESVYALLARAMDESGLAGIATYVMRDRQHLGCLRVRDGAVTLAKMFFADEVRPPQGVVPRRVEVGSRELAMAAELIERFTGTFEPGKYEDTYRAALLEVIRAKQRGEKVPAPKAAKPEASPDLMEALRRSLEDAKASPARKRPIRRRAAARTSGRRKEPASRSGRRKG